MCQHARFRASACLTGLVALVAATSVPAQDLDALKLRVLEATGGERPLPSRGLILTREAKAGIGLRPGIGAPLPVHACPLCKQPMTNVPLWRERPGIDSSGEWTAHVCERDELIFATLRGVMRHAECGPFALPRPGAKAVRVAMPWGALPEPPAPPTPKSTWPVPDGSMWTEDAPDGRLVVRDAERTLFREPPDAGPAEMGMFGDACKVSPSARLVAFARSQSPLIVGDLATGRVRARLPMRGSNVVAVAIAPDGSEVVFLVSEAGQQTPSLRRLVVATGKATEIVRDMEHAPNEFLFADRAQLLITAAHSHHGVITAYQKHGRERRWQVSIDGKWTGWRSNTLSPDHRRLLVVTRGGLHAELLDVATGALECAADLQSISGRDSGSGAVFSADSRQFAWISVDGRIARGDIATPGELHVHFGQAGAYGAPTWAADGRSLVTTDAEGIRLRWPIDRFLAPH